MVEIMRDDDFKVCNHVIEYTLKVIQALKNTCEHLEKGGILVMVVSEYIFDLLRQIR